MSGDQLDLDAIETWAQAPIATFRERQEFVGRTRVDVVPALVAEVRRLRALVPELEPGRWWRVLQADGDLWCETSRESEARAAMRPGYTLENLHRAEVTGWREVP